MKQLAEILKSTPVNVLINAKPSAKKNLISLLECDTIKTALITFSIQDIESILIRACSDGTTTNFVGIISSVNLLKFIFTADKDIPVPDLLNLELAQLVKDPDLVQEIEFIPPESSLMHILLEVWGKTCKLITEDTDCHHLLTTNEEGKYTVITPLDFLRHILFLNENSLACMKDLPATEIENGFDIDASCMVTWNDEAQMVMERMIKSHPNYLIAIVNEETGCLEANITFFDFLPKDPELLEELVSMARHSGVSIQAYLRTLLSLQSPTSSIDPIILFPHFSIYDIIEKLTRLRIHHLWRVTPDGVRKPIGAVGTIDVLRYLCFMFRPFMQEDEALKKNIVSEMCDN